MTDISNLIYVAIILAFIIAMIYMQSIVDPIIKSFKFIKQLVQTLLDDISDKCATILTIIIMVMIITIPYVIGRYIIIPNVKIENIMVKNITDTTADFDIEANSDKVKWDIYLVCTDNGLRKVDGGRSKNGHSEKLLPNLNYIIRVKGDNDDKLITTKSASAISPPYLECTYIDKSESNIINVHLHNNGKNKIRGKLTYIITDDNRNFAEDGSKIISLAGGQDKVVKIKNDSNKKNIKLYYDMAPIIGN